MKDGFIKVAAITPGIKVADCEYNAKVIADAAKAAAKKGVKLAVFPELSVCGYTVGDLILHDTLIDGCNKALGSIAAATSASDIVIVVGAPIVNCNKLYDCAVVINRGKVIGISPKSNIPNYGEFYELRYFTPYDGAPIPRRSITAWAMCRCLSDICFTDARACVISALPQRYARTCGRLARRRRHYAARGRIS